MQDQIAILPTLLNSVLSLPVTLLPGAFPCPKCGKEARPFEMYGTRDYYGIPFRRVCAKCYERIMTTTGYDGVKYDERDENLDADY